MATRLKRMRSDVRNHAVYLRNKEEVDLIAFVKILWKVKFVVISTVVLFLFLGIIKSITSPEEYTSQSILLTEQIVPTGLGPLSSLAGISGLRGMNAQNGADVGSIPPDLYVKILDNDEIIYPLLKKPFYFEDLGEEMDLVTFFTAHEPLDFFQKLRPSYVRRLLFGNKSPQTESSEGAIGGIQALDTTVTQVSSLEQSAITRLKARMEVVQDQRLIEISLKMPDKRVAAQLNVEIINSLRDYITQKNTERRRQNLEFVEKQTDEARAKFEDVQLRLASLRDKNMGIITQRARATEERLQSEYELSFQMYHNLAQQLEQAKIQYQESKPILTIFKNPNLPLRPSEPRPVITMIVFGVLGLFVGILSIFALLFYEYGKLV